MYASITIMKNIPVYIFAVLWSALIEACMLLILPLLSKMKFASQWNISDRCGLPHLRERISGRTVIWIHAASLGESKLLVRFLGIIKKKHPKHVYVLTAATRTGAEYLSGIADRSIVAAGFLPLDTLRLMKKMIVDFSVTRLWIMETEIWPSLMASCMKAGIPVGVVNGRMEVKSFTSYNRFRFICAPIFRFLDIVLAQDEAYAGRFKLMGVKSDTVHVIGNLKSLVEIGPPSVEQRKALRTSMKIEETDFVLSAGCIHEGEGKILRETIEILEEKNIKIKIIAIPRHLNETQALISEIGKSILHLKDTVAAKSWKICIVEKMGVLEDIYKASDAAFIGGTFVPIGGHNVWDAAKFCIPVFFGPDFHTQTESCRQLIDSGAGFTAANANELADLVLKAQQTGNKAFVSTLSMYIQASRQRIDRIWSLIP